MNQFCPAKMIVRTTLGTHNPRISAQTVTHCLLEIRERPPYTMYVLYAAFLFWPSIYTRGEQTLGAKRLDGETKSWETQKPGFFMTCLQIQ